MLGAFFSVFLIWIVTGILVYMAVDRIIRKNYDIDARIMALTAGLGVLVNIVSVFAFFLCCSDNPELSVTIVFIR